MSGSVLLSSLALAMARVDTGGIPPITHPLGRSWGQPSPREIVIDDTHALMSRRTFEALAEYSASMPTGVYEGKMWRRHDGAFDPRCKPSDRRWLLCWYGASDKPDHCSINTRILLVEEGPVVA